jgi:UDP-glucuronate decarboxylase
MKYFLIGDAYFLGQKIGEALVKQGNEVMFFDSLIRPGAAVYDLGKVVLSDISSEYSMKVSISSFKPDVIMFLCDTKLDAIGNYQPLADYGAVISSIRILCDSLSVHKVKSIYLRSSCEVYGLSKKVRHGKIKESDVCNPVSYRGCCLSAAENLLRVHCFNQGVSFTSFRLFDMYGKNPAKNTSDIVSTIIRAASSNSYIGVGGMNKTRDFIHIDDVVGSIIGIMEGEYVGPINIGTGVSIKLGALVAKVLKISGSKGNVVEIVGNKLPFVSYIADTSLLEKFYRPEIGILSSLEDIYRFYSQESGNVK